MTYKAFLIKYAEIAIKGKNRYLFEDALVSQMNHALKKVDGTFHIRKEQGRIRLRWSCGGTAACVWYRGNLSGCAVGGRRL